MRDPTHVEVVCFNLLQPKPVGDDGGHEELSDGEGDEVVKVLIPQTKTKT